MCPQKEVTAKLNWVQYVYLINEWVMWVQYCGYIIVPNFDSNLQP